MFDFLSKNMMFVLNWIVPLGVTVFLIYDRSRSGSYNLRKEIVDDYKERNLQLQSQAKEQELQFQSQIKQVKEELHKTALQVSELKGLMIGKDKQIEALTLILQDRNPETIKILKEIKELNQRVVDLLGRTSFETAKELKHQTKILEKGQKRDENIDKSSKEHSGDPLRVKLKN